MRLLPTLLFAVYTAASAAGQTFQATDYVRTDAMIPMRDGVKLFTVIIAPKSSPVGLPFYFTRTPYGVADIQASGISRSPLVPDGFIFVFQDIRGRFKSEGTFVMMRPTHFNTKVKVDEGTDAWDTIDWLVKNVPRNNGRAAILGGSYDGWTALQAAINPHPALKLAIPQASPLDMWMNDDFHRYGAFRLSYGLEYSYMMESSKENQPFDLMKGQDAYDWYLNLGPLSNVNANWVHGKLPTWNAFVEHPNHDDYWKDQSVANILSHGPKIPTISIGGFWDQEDPWGPQETYRLFAKHDPHHYNHIVLGPWNHGGWGGSGRKLGPIQFGSNTGDYYREHVWHPALLYYLKDRPMAPLPAATVFVTGSNEWKTFDQWPPKQVRSPESLPFLPGDKKQPTVPLYFNLNHELTWEHPDQIQVPYDSYISDPANPVPYRKRPIQPTYGPGSEWYTWQVQDQSFVQTRPDVLTYETASLPSDIDVIGNLQGVLYASTSGTDSDWVMKLIDEYPSSDPNLPGYELPINMEICRARFRNGAPKEVTPEEPVEYKIDMHAIAHRFLKGHRIMVQVQSSWFPLIDRNPQTFVPNIFLATHDDFQKATQKIYHWADYSSRVELPIAKG